MKVHMQEIDTEIQLAIHTNASTFFNVLSVNHKNLALYSILNVYN